MKKPLQIDWLDYWFKPRIEFVRLSDFINRVRQIEATKATILTVEVKRDGYLITATKTNDAPKHETMATQRQKKVTV